MDKAQQDHHIALKPIKHDMPETIDPEGTNTGPQLVALTPDLGILLQQTNNSFDFIEQPMRSAWAFASDPGISVRDVIDEFGTSENSHAYPALRAA